jgi:hypothetical protein
MWGRMKYIIYVQYTFSTSLAVLEITTQKGYCEYFTNLYIQPPNSAPGHKSTFKEKTRRRLYWV